MSQEYKNLGLIAVLVSSSVWINYFANEHSEDEVAVSAIPPAPSFHLRDSCSTVVVPVLGYNLK